MDSLNEDKTPKFDFEVERAKAEELENKVIEKFYLLLNTPLGRDFLKYILVNFCNFGSELRNDKERIEWNVGLKILCSVGAFRLKDIDRTIAALTMLGAGSVNPTNTE